MHLLTFKEIYKIRQIELSRYSGIPTSSIDKYLNYNSMPGRDALWDLFALTGGLVTANDFAGLDHLKLEQGLRSGKYKTYFMHKAEEYLLKPASYKLIGE